MSDSEIQRKLEKLEKLEKGNRARVRRYMKKVKGDGKKQISAIVSGETYDEITRRKNASQPPLTNGQVIEQAILGFINTYVKTDVSINEPESKSKLPTVSNLPDLLDGIDTDNLTREDRDQLVLKLYEQFPGKAQAKDRIKVLNDAGILLSGEPWTVKRYSDQLTCARRRAKK